MLIVQHLFLRPVEQRHGARLRGLAVGRGGALVEGTMDGRRARSSSQERGHVGRDAVDGAVSVQVPGVHEVSPADAGGVFSAERVQRGVRPVIRRLDLDGADLLAVWHDEVDLVVAVRSRLGPGVVEQASSMGGELLGDDVLVDHAEVHGQLVRQELPVHDVVGEVRVLEHEGHEQAGVREI